MVSNAQSQLSTDESQEKTAFEAVDWRIALGSILTFLWIGAGIVYLFGKVGMVNFVNLPTADIGSFLEGAFAPLAFLWLVIGHFIQQKEISANTLAIQIQQQSAERQEIHARRDSYFKLSTLVHEQLGNIAGFHYVSVLGVTGTGEVSMEEFIQMRAESASDPGLFVRKMIELVVSYRAQEKDLNELFFGTEIRTRHTNNYTKAFSKLMNIAQTVDQDDLICDGLLKGSPAGFLYRVIRHLEGVEPMDPFTGASSS